MVRAPILRERAVFVDTSAFYAYLDRDDQWHEKAVRGFLLLSRERCPLFTTNLVVAETYTLALYRLAFPTAMAWLSALDSVNFVYQRQEHHPKLQALLERYRGHGFSYTDAFSFTAMEEEGISVAFAFDRHFQDYGWTDLDP